MKCSTGATKKKRKKKKNTSLHICKNYIECMLNLKVFSASICYGIHVICFM